MPGKLRYYCAACRKQCRDSHGFKQHCETPKHLSAMQEFSADPQKFLNQWSTEFEQGFIEVVKSRKIAGQPLTARKIYAQLLADPEATKISGTRWNTLEAFVKEVVDRQVLILNGDELKIPGIVDREEERAPKRAKLEEAKMTMPEATAKNPDAAPVQFKIKMNIPVKSKQPEPTIFSDSESSRCCVVWKFQLIKMSRSDYLFLINPGGEVTGFASERKLEPPPALPARSGQPQLHCLRCNILLEYRSGAAFVQCPHCQTFNSVTSAGAPTRTIQMLCQICGVNNLAPWGASLVRCGVCGTISDVSRIYR